MTWRFVGVSTSRAGQPGLDETMEETMANKKAGGKRLNKTHTVRHKMAEEIYYLCYTRDDNNYRKAKTREIDEWLADGNFFGVESPAELAGEWQAYERESDLDEEE